MTAPLQLLLVEDNEADIYLTRETLAQTNRQIEVSVAKDGVEARAFLQRCESGECALPHLILLDLNLPRLDGHGLLHWLRSVGPLKRIPVIILSSSEAHLDIERCYAGGANCYLTKPVGLDAFRSLIRAVERFWLETVRLP